MLRSGQVFFRSLYFCLDVFMDFQSTKLINTQAGANCLGDRIAFVKKIAIVLLNSINISLKRVA